MGIFNRILGNRALNKQDLSKFSSMNKPLIGGVEEALNQLDLAATYLRDKGFHVQTIVTFEKKNGDKEK